MVSVTPDSSLYQGVNQWSHGLRKNTLKCDLRFFCDGEEFGKRKEEGDSRKKSRAKRKVEKGEKRREGERSKSNENKERSERRKLGGAKAKSQSERRNEREKLRRGIGEAISISFERPRRKQETS